MTYRDTAYLKIMYLATVPSPCLRYIRLPSHSSGWFVPGLNKKYFLVDENDIGATQIRNGTFRIISALPRFLRYLRGLEMGFSCIHNIFFLHFKCRKTHFKTAAITMKQRGKYHFRIRKPNTKFHIKVRKPHLKLRKALFKRGLESNPENKTVLEFDVEKIVGIFFLIKKIVKKRVSF